MTGNVRFNDTIKAEFGSSADLQINHDGTDTLINNGTGNLTIRQSANDKDIIFQNDDGSGGETPYLTLDGGLGYTTVQKKIRFADSVLLELGSGGDLEMFHNGNSFINNNGSGGDLSISNYANDKDIILGTDDGSGGVAPYFCLDGSVADGSNVLTRFPDQSILGFGSGSGFQDGLQIYHNATSSFINNYVGNLEISNNTNDGDIIFKTDDGSGGGAEYLRLDGGTTTIQAYKDLLIANDTAKLKLGASQDLQIFHNGTHSYVDSNNTGDLYLRSLNDDVIVQAADDVFIYTQGGEDAIIALGNAEVKLYYNNSKKFETTNTGVDVTGTINFAGGASTGNLSFGDSNQLQLGTGNDLRIYHSGTHGFITNNVSGSLYIQSGNSVQIESDAGENMIVASANGAVQLYYNNCSKLQTTCSGIGVCGNALISGHVCATTKSFVIDNPTTDGKLRYSVVEGNEHGVTVRGSTCSDTIELPDEWDWLVEEDSVTAQITPVGGPHQPYIVSQDNKQVVVCSDGCYNYNVYGTRKDVKPLEVNIP